MRFTTAGFHARLQESCLLGELSGFPFKDPSHMSPGRLMSAMQLEQEKKKRKKKKRGVRRFLCYSTVGHSVAAHQPNAPHVKYGG